MDVFDLYPAMYWQTFVEEQQCVRVAQPEVVCRVEYWECLGVPIVTNVSGRLISFTKEAPH